MCGFSCSLADESKLRYIIFEDLTPLGYKDPDLRAGLDYNHLKIAIKRLAEWHAASAHLLKKVSNKQ